MDSLVSNWIITIVCEDRPGIVHGLSGAIVEAAGNITESQQFSSPDTGRFFMRLQVDIEGSDDRLRSALSDVASTFGMQFTLTPSNHAMTTLVLGSLATHCVNDLLAKQRDGHLSIHVPLVLSNHRELNELASFYGVGFEYLPMSSPTDKAHFEDRLLEIVKELNVDLVVLARFMQILSPRVCSQLPGRMINIHHSFLPGFKGANPYQQAHERGVKLIGATAHFVTADLDEGPIIEQNVVRVDHSRTVSELKRVGQDEESRTLTRAVDWFSQRRILLDGSRTIVFR